jgi:hypothetical protein
MWNWKTQTELYELPYNADGWGFMKFLKDGRLATEWDVKRANVWNVTTARLDLSLAVQGLNMEELSCGLLATTNSDGCIHFWNSTDASLVSIIKTPQQQNFLRQTGLTNYLASIDSNGVLYMWNLTDNTLCWNQTLGSSPVTIESMTNGNLVTVTSDGWIRIWNVLTGFCYNSFFPLNSAINGATMTANNTLIASGNTNTIVVLQIDLNSQFNVLTTVNPTSAVKAVKVTQENMLLAAVGGNINLYNLNTSTFVGSYVVTSSTSINSLANYGILK